jgi:ribosomal protein S18 acetylase RimI-like enzyme
MAQEPALTIYNQNFAVVRQNLKFDLKAGVTPVEFTDITAKLEPESVVLRDPTGKRALLILEQNYQPDPISQEALLLKYEGQTIDFQVRTGDRVETVSGKLDKGTYFLRPNQSGGGNHVANCGYITDVATTGRGVARVMCAHSLEHARARGFRAMQFNFVVSTNERAVRLWKSFGFEIVGTLPGAFCHPRLGYVDAFVMYRTL